MNCPRCGATVVERRLASGTGISCCSDWSCHFAVIVTPHEPTEDDRMIALAAKATLLSRPTPTAADLARAAALADELGLGGAETPHDRREATCV